MGEEKGNKSLDNRQAVESVERMGAISARGPSGIIHCMSIIGHIEGHQTVNEQTKTTSYEHVMPQLAAIEESADITGLLMLINTMGGDVEAGLGIAELVASMRKPTASLVLGGSHSIGVPIAVAAMRSFIVPSACMTLHPVRLSGTVIGVKQTYDYFDRIQQGVIDFILRNSKVTREKLLSMIFQTGELASDIGSVIYGQQAVDYGIIDCLGGLKDALSFLHDRIDERNGIAHKNSDGISQENNTTNV